MQADPCSLERLRRRRTFPVSTSKIRPSLGSMYLVPGQPCGSSRGEPDARGASHAVLPRGPCRPGYGEGDTKSPEGGAPVADRSFARMADAGVAGDVVARARCRLQHGHRGYLVGILMAGRIAPADGRQGVEVAVRELDGLEWFGSAPPVSVAAAYLVADSGSPQAEEDAR